MNSIAEMLAADTNLDATFRRIFAVAPRPVDPKSDDEKDPEQKPVPVSQEGGE